MYKYRFINLRGSYDKKPDVHILGLAFTSSSRPISFEIIPNVYISAVHSKHLPLPPVTFSFISLSLLIVLFMRLCLWFPLCGN